MDDGWETLISEQNLNDQDMDQEDDDANLMKLIGEIWGGALKIL